MMFLTKKLYRRLLSILLVFGIILLAADAGHSRKKKEKKKEESYVMTEAELQSQVMSFADRFTSIISQSFDNYAELSPPIENHRIVLGNTAYSMASAYTIAAETDPDVALLDMVVMVTLGRMIYEEHWLVKFGPQVEPMVKGFRRAEEDIWQIAALVLKPDEQKELYAIIQEFRQNYPEELSFSYLRFSDFAAGRRKSMLSRTGQVKGLFKSVEVATKHVEDIKLLAERGMFLATRLPLLTGYFADVWVSQLILNPEVKEILTDLHRFVDVTEQLPQTIARERKLILEQGIKKFSAERRAAIKQLMDRVAIERKNTINDFLAEEVRLRGVLTDLKQTVNEGNNLILSADSLAKRLGFEPGASPSEFDINDYKETIAEANVTAKQLNSLVASVERLVNAPGFENLLPQLEKTINRVEAGGEKLIGYTFGQAVLLMLIGLVGYFLAKIAYQYFSRKLNQTGLQ